MKAVLPDWLSPVTATRSVRSCKSAVNVGSLLRQITLKEGKSLSLGVRAVAGGLPAQVGEARRSSNLARKHTSALTALTKPLCGDADLSSGDLGQEPQCANPLSWSFSYPLFGW